MASGDRNYVKIATPIRTMKSEIGQMKVSLFNDQISLQMAPATGKTEYNTIKYNGSPQFAPNVRFSLGVGAAMANLIEKKLIPELEGGRQFDYEIFACKRGNYESYVRLQSVSGQLQLTGIEVNNGQRKTAAYSFPETIIKEGSGQTVKVQGEALAFAHLLSEIGAGNEVALHMRQYNQAVKDNIPQGGYGNQGQSQNNNQSQPMNSWSPS